MEIEPLTSVGEVAAHTGEIIESDVDVSLCNSMIRAASAHVRFYGRPWPLRETAPDIARTIATSAAARGYMNPSGYTDERSDSVTLKRSDLYASDTRLTPEEIEMLKELKGQASVRSIRLDLGGDYFTPRSQSDCLFVRRNPDECVPMGGSGLFAFVRVPPVGRARRRRRM